MISFDTAVLLWGIQGTSRASQNEMILRTQRYMQSLAKQRTRVCIPAPVVAEYLAGFEPSEHEKQLLLLDKSFFIAAFDLKAAVLAARITAQHCMLRQIRQECGQSRQQLRVDAMILATAVVAGAQTLVSQDSHMQQLAQFLPGTIQVLPVPEIVQSDLFDDQD